MFRPWRRGREAKPAFVAPDVPATFEDPALEARFRELGHVVVDLMGPEELAEIAAAHERHHPAPTSTWSSDFYDPSPEVKADVAAVIARTFQPGIDRILVDHRPILSNFVVNWPGPDGGLPIHHHTSVVDDRHHRSVVIWAAINDATEENGTLHVVERSHLVPRGPWGEGRPHWFESRRGALMEHHLTSVTLTAGQALVFDNSLLHCSLPNAATQPRRSAVAIVAPNRAPLRYYRWREGEGTAAYELDPTFFIDTPSPWGVWADPEGLTYLGSLPDDDTLATEEEIEGLLGPGTCSHLVSPDAYTSHP